LNIFKTDKRVNATELISQNPNMACVIKVESLLQPWINNSSNHKKLWRKLYSQTAQESNLATTFTTKIAHNSTVTYIYNH